MKRSKVFSLAIVGILAVGLSACGSKDSASEDKGNDWVIPSEIEQIVKKNCISCHGNNLEGSGGIPSLQKLGATYSEEEIVDIITNGRGGMPDHLLNEKETAIVAKTLANQK
ncbi:MAG: c-type cytochrome [Bacilli bacterium]